MSFDFWWVLGFVKPEEDGLLRPYFDRALGDADFNDRADAILAKWRADPDCVVFSNDTYDDYAAFCYAFLPPDLGFHVVGTGDCTFEVGEESVFKFLIFGGHSPCCILWGVLGADRAEKLPGIRGNLLLRPEEVGPALDATEAVLRDLPEDAELLRRADDFLGYKRGRLADYEGKAILEIARALPETLAEAKRRNLGAFAIGMTQL